MDTADPRAVERLEAARFLTGRGTYVADLQFDGMGHVAFLRSDVAHGRVIRIDTAAARAVDGVRAVLTAADFGPSIPTLPLRLAPIAGVERFMQPVIATDTVRYVGEPLAIVVADSRPLAEDALELIEVEIEPLPVVPDCAASIRGDVVLHPQIGTNIATQYTVGKGDVAAAFASADYTRKETFRSNRHTASPLETRGLIASWDAGKAKLTMHGTGKVPHTTRKMLSTMLGLAIEQMEMIEVDIGGGFGVRGEFHPEDFLIPATARAVGGTVKWIEDRREHLSSANHSREIECELEIACRRDGTVLALRGTVIGDMGAYIRPNSGVVVAKAAQFAVGPYRIANVHMDVVFALTSKTPIGTYRGPGRFEAHFFRERLLDMAAADLGIDPAELRLKNLITTEEMPYSLGHLVPYEREAVLDTGDFPGAFRRALDELGWDRLQASRGQLIDGRYHGIAATACMESSGPGPREHARMCLSATGRVEIHVGSSNMGQGLETIFAQIAGGALGLPVTAFDVYHGSTTHLADGLGTYASRAVVMGGSAVLVTAKSFAEALAAFNAETGSNSGELSPESLARIAAEATRRGRSIDVEGKYESTVLTWTSGAHAAHVAVDPATGHVEVLDYVAIEDVGRAINPALVHGQAIGGAVQGLGGAFLDHLVYNEDGQLLTGSFMDYLLPLATDFPNVRGVTLEEHPSPSNPLGAKGAGEGAIVMVAATIGNAIASALGPLGVRINELPFSPARIHGAIAEARARG